MEPASPGNLIFKPDPTEIEPIAIKATESSPPENNTEDWTSFDEREFAKLFEQLGFKKIAEQHDAAEQAKRKDYKQTLRAMFPAVFKMMSLVGTTNAAGQLVPKSRLAIKETVDRPTKQFQLLLKGEKDKAQFCEIVAQLIAFELEYIQVIHEYNEACTRNKIFQDILFESMPAQFMGNLYMLPLPKSFEIKTTAAFAFYLRFTKKLHEAKSQLRPHFNPQDADVFRCLLQNEDPAVKTQISYFATVCQQTQEAEKITFAEHKLAPLLHRMQVFLSDQTVFEVCKHLTPALAVLNALDVNMCETTTHTGNFDPKTDLGIHYYLPLRKEILQDLCDNYLDRQSLIYEQAYSYIKDPSKEFLEPRFLRSNHASLLNKIRPPKIDNSKQLAEELLKEEEEAKKVTTAKKKGPPRNRNTKQLKVQTIDFKAKLVTKAADTPTVVSRLLSIVAPTLHQASFLQRHERVRRWLQVSPNQLGVIKTFKDRRNGQDVFQYAKMNDQELRTHLTLHGFSSLVDKLLGNPELKDKYCYQTPRGVALFVELIRENKSVQRGVLNFGLDGALCFHRKIDLKTDEEFLHQSYDQLADWKTDEEEDAAKLQALKEELESGFEGADEFQVDEKLETISVTDRRLKCQIRIFPLK